MSLSRFRNSSSPAFLALGCVLAASPALAQEAQTASAPKLGGVTVTDTAIDEDSYKVDKVDSPKYTAPLVDTPRSITVIPSQVIRDTASASLTEALRTVPGITLGAGEGGNPQGDRPFIRGFDSQASTYLDGVRDIGAQSREVFAVEQIEVVKGSDSSMGGRGSAGGSINLVSKTPTADRFAAASGSVGTDDYKRVTLDVNQPLNDFVGVRLAAMYHDQDIAGRDAVWSKRWGVAPSVKLGLNGPTSLTIGYYHLESNELPDSGIPYLYTSANAPAGVTETAPAEHFTTISGVDVDRPRDAFYGLKDRDFRKTNVNNLTIRAQHEFDNGITLRNTSRYGRSEQDYVLTQPDDQQGNVYGVKNAAGTITAPGNQVWRRANTRYGYAEGLINQTDLFGDANLFGLKNSFAASLEFAREKASTGSYVSNAATGTAIATGSTVSPRCSANMVARYNCTSVDNPNPSDPWVSYTGDGTTIPTDIVRSLPKTRTLTRIDSWGASLFDTVTITDNLLLNLGGRYDHYKTVVSPGLAATSTANRLYVSRTDNLWNYQAGLVFKPTADSSIYISTSSAATPPGAYLGQGSEGNALNTTIPTSPTAPTPQELTDALKIERTKSYEVGTKWNLFDNTLSLSLAAFQTQTKNARTTGDNNTVVFVGNRRIRGIEFGFNGNITPEWSVFGGYTYMDAKIVDGGNSAPVTVKDTVTGQTVTINTPSPSTGTPFPNTPKHSFTAFTNYNVTSKFTLGGGAIYMSKIYGGIQNVGSPTLANGQITMPRTLARMVPSYWRFDASASYKINDIAQLQLNVQNVFNELYYDKAYTAHFASQAPGRTAILTLNVKY
ncbi:catecholate siderophore receptor [Novosphingobium sp. PhB165]|uniref:TonB-dependent receptor n=1 Tax=Novosphingobium sp. PhB165 TaxID=2485105 RepID=UPI0010437B92|nr:TonB-dependent receptor [Novosphingobium sp. PhB165]TCM14955.1 catecholate siderophore receptor [Novosphingobium sp. PhB165]